MELRMRATDGWWLQVRPDRRGARPRDAAGPAGVARGAAAGALAQVTGSCPQPAVAPPPLCRVVNGGVPTDYEVPPPQV